MMNLDRRRLLKSTAGPLALPWLDSLSGFTHAAEAAVGPRRLLMICLPLGIYRDALMPKGSGENYETTEYLSLIGAFRDQTTIISGLDHPGVAGGHGAEPRIFTGIPTSQSNQLSLDQYVASRIGGQTRFDSLALSAGRNEFSWTASGTQVPAESTMSAVYARLFGAHDRAGTDERLREIGQGKSIMDLTRRQAERLRPSLSPVDQDKLDEYFESVRETERRLAKSELWVHTPKPSVDLPAPQDPDDRGEIVTQLRNVCDLTYLAFQTDSTRVITFGYFQQNTVNIPGVRNAYHALSHHGKNPSNITQLKLIEGEFFKQLARLLTKLRDTPEGESTLLDQTTILITSNLGNGSSHSNKDLPVLLVGGRYAHGCRLAFEPSTIPLSNLFVSILNQLGFADRRFATATGPLEDLGIG